MKTILKSKAFISIIVIFSVLVLAAGIFLTIVGVMYNDRKTAVVVIPGLLCSSLEEDETGEIFYDPLETDTHGFSFDDFGSNKMISLVVDIALHTKIVQKVGDVLDEVPGNFLDKFELDETGAPIYSSKAVQWDHDGYAKYGAMTMMKTPYEYYANLYSNKKNYDTFIFQYDWRRDNRIAANQLIEACKDYDDVIIVAHSMGNIVSSLAIAKNETFRKKVILNCSYASPYLGSFNALRILENGEETVGSLLGTAHEALDNNKLLNTLFSSILEKADNICYEKVLPIFRKMPGIVQLLPTIDLVCPDGITSNLTVNGNAITTKEELLNYYQSCKWAHENEDMNAPVRSWVADLDEYWDAFYVNGVHATKLVNTHYFAGNDINTTKSATIIKEQGQYATSYETVSDKGDGTVLYVSATINETKNVYPTQGYSHTDLGQAFIQELCIPQTIEATKSIDNPYKIWWIKLGH